MSFNLLGRIGKFENLNEDEVPLDEVVETVKKKTLCLNCYIFNQKLTLHYCITCCLFSGFCSVGIINRAKINFSWLEEEYMYNMLKCIKNVFD